MDAKKQIVIFIDQQEFKLEDREYTPRELLTLAGDDPSDTTLAVKRENEIVKLPDLDKPLQPKNGPRFIVYHDSPTPVS